MKGFARSLGCAAGAALLAASVAATAVAASATNFITNPSGVGGLTTGWSVGGGTGQLSGVQANGQWWLKYVPQTYNQYGGAWVVNYLGSSYAVGSSITCAGEFMGTGSAWLIAAAGAGNKSSNTITLSSTPTELSETFTMTTANFGVQIQVRSKTSSTVYFNRFSCVAGTTAELAAVPSVSGSSASTSSTTTSSSTASASSTTASKTTSSTATSTTASTATSTTKASSTSASTTPTTSTAKGSTTSSIPKTGSGPLPAVVGAALLVAGTMLLRRQRAAR